MKDTGCGINPEAMNKLFQKFTQFNSDCQRRKVGTGLGLFITKELINKMKGTIRAYSKLNEGTAFIICLPVNVIQRGPDLNNSMNKSIVTQAIKPVRREIRVLVVDDQEINNFILIKYLAKLEITNISTARDGIELYEKYLHA